MPKKGDYIDLVGMKYGRLSVVSFSEIKDRKTYFLCRCECGKEKIVESSKLRSGHTKSCGCIGIDRIRNLNYKTGLTKTKLYYSYRNMLNRCYRTTTDMYRLYGQRGIGVCDEWLGEDGFLNFSKWAKSNNYKDGLQLDRIDNEKGYSPDNCRFVDSFVQANNKRNNRFVKVNGEVATVGNMARKHGVSYWNLLHYSKGGRNTKYPHLEIEVAHGK